MTCVGVKPASHSGHALSSHETGRVASFTGRIERRWSVDGAAPSHHPRMPKFRIVLITAVIVSTLAAAPGRAAPTRTLAPAESSPAAVYSSAVVQICAGALLFDHAHPMGTRADALAIAEDIRASTARRLARVIALSVPPT